MEITHHATHPVARKADGLREYRAPMQDSGQLSRRQNAEPPTLGPVVAGSLRGNGHHEAVMRLHKQLECEVGVTMICISLQLPSAIKWHDGTTDSGC